MRNHTCTHPGCKEFRVKRNLCFKHWRVWNASPDRPTPPPPPGPCTVDGCTTLSYCRDLCGMHYNRLLRYGSPSQTLERDRSCLIIDCRNQASWITRLCSEHAHHPSPTAAERWRAWIKPGYYGVHRRVYRLKGAARLHACINCGLQARHWAYDHKDPDELTDESVGLLYSHNTDHYQPMCQFCHAQLDAAHRRQARALSSGVPR